MLSGRKHVSKVLSVSTVALLFGRSRFFGVCFGLLVRFNAFNFRLLSFYRCDFGIGEFFLFGDVSVAEGVRVVTIVNGLLWDNGVTMLFCFFSLTVNVGGLISILFARFVLYLSFLGLLTHVCRRGVVVFLATFLRRGGANQGAYAVRCVDQRASGNVCVIFLLCRRATCCPFYVAARRGAI